MNDPRQSDEMQGFQTTHWSVVLSARQPDHEQTDDWRSALERLCQQYWFPLYAYLRRKGYGTDDAQDLTQGFFASLIEKDFLKSVDPGRGRFRWFMMDAIKKFAAKWNAAESAKKRGGGRQFLSIDFDDGESRYSREPVDTWTPERLFDRQWALSLLTSSIDQLKKEYETTGKQRFFETLRVYLTLDNDSPSYAESARQLGLSTTAVRVAIHRLRRRYRETIRQMVAETLDEVDSLDNEIDELLAAL